MLTTEYTEDTQRAQSGRAKARSYGIRVEEVGDSQSRPYRRLPGWGCFPSDPVERKKKGGRLPNSHPRLPLVSERRLEGMADSCPTVSGAGGHAGSGVASPSHDGAVAIGVALRHSDAEMESFACGIVAKRVEFHSRPRAALIDRSIPNCGIDIADATALELGEDAGQVGYIFKADLPFAFGADFEFDVVYGCVAACMDEQGGEQDDDCQSDADY